MLPMTTSNFTSFCANMDGTASLELCVNQHCPIKEALGLSSVGSVDMRTNAVSNQKHD